MSGGYGGRYSGGAATYGGDDLGDLDGIDFGGGGGTHPTFLPNAA